MAKDILGQELAVGDAVVINPPHVKGLAVGIVKKINAKSVTVNYQDIVYWKQGEMSTCSRQLDWVVKVDQNYALMYYMTLKQSHE